MFRIFVFYFSILFYRIKANFAHPPRLSNFQESFTLPLPPSPPLPSPTPSLPSIKYSRVLVFMIKIFFYNWNQCCLKFLSNCLTLGKNGWKCANNHYGWHQMGKPKWNTVNQEMIKKYRSSEKWGSVHMRKIIPPRKGNNSNEIPP